MLFLIKRDQNGNWSAPDTVLQNVLIGASWSHEAQRIAYVDDGWLRVWNPETRTSDALFTDASIEGYRFDLATASAPVHWSEDGTLILVKMLDENRIQSFWTYSRMDGRARKVLDLGDAHVPQSVQVLAGDRLYYTVAESEGDVWLLNLQSDEN